MSSSPDSMNMVPVPEDPIYDEPLESQFTAAHPDPESDYDEDIEVEPHYPVNEEQQSQRHPLHQGLQELPSFSEHRLSSSNTAHRGSHEPIDDNHAHHDSNVSRVGETQYVELEPETQQDSLRSIVEETQFTGLVPQTQEDSPRSQYNEARHIHFSSENQNRHQAPHTDPDEFPMSSDSQRQLQDITAQTTIRDSQMVPSIFDKPLIKRPKEPIQDPEVGFKFEKHHKPTAQYSRVIGRESSNVPRPVPSGRSQAMSTEDTHNLEAVDVLTTRRFDNVHSADNGNTQSIPEMETSAKGSPSGRQALSSSARRESGRSAVIDGRDLPAEPIPCETPILETSPSVLEKVFTPAVVNDPQPSPVVLPAISSPQGDSNAPNEKSQLAGLTNRNLDDAGSNHTQPLASIVKHTQTDAAFPNTQHQGDGLVPQSIDTIHDDLNERQSMDKASLNMAGQSFNTPTQGEAHYVQPSEQNVPRVVLPGFGEMDLPATMPSSGQLHPQLPTPGRSPLPHRFLNVGNTGEGFIKARKPSVKKAKRIKQPFPEVSLQPKHGRRRQPIPRQPLTDLTNNSRSAPLDCANQVHGLKSNSPPDAYPENSTNKFSLSSKEALYQRTQSQEDIYAQPNTTSAELMMGALQSPSGHVDWVSPSLPVSKADATNLSAQNEEEINAESHMTSGETMMNFDLSNTAHVDLANPLTSVSEANVAHGLDAESILPAATMIGLAGEADTQNQDDIVDPKARQQVDELVRPKLSDTAKRSDGPISQDTSLGGVPPEIINGQHGAQEALLPQKMDTRPQVDHTSMAACAPAPQTAHTHSKTPPQPDFPAPHNLSSHGGGTRKGENQCRVTSTLDSGSHSGNELRSVGLKHSSQESNRGDEESLAEFTGYSELQKADAKDITALRVGNIKLKEELEKLKTRIDARGNFYRDHMNEALDQADSLADMGNEICANTRQALKETREAQAEHRKAREQAQKAAALQQKIKNDLTDLRKASATMTNLVETNKLLKTDLDRILVELGQEKKLSRSLQKRLDDKKADRNELEGLLTKAQSNTVKELTKDNGTLVAIQNSVIGLQSKVDKLSTVPDPSKCSEVDVPPVWEKELEGLFARLDGKIQQSSEAAAVQGESQIKLLNDLKGSLGQPHSDDEEKTRLRDQITAMQADNTTLNGSITTKEREMDNLKSKLESLGKELANRSSELTEKTKELEAALARPQEDPRLHAQLHELEQTKASLQDQVDVANREVSQVTDELRLLRETSQFTQKQMTEAKSKLSEAESKIEQFATQKKSYEQASKQHLEKRLQEFAKKANERKDEMQIRYDSMLTTLSQIRAGLEQQLATTKETLGKKQEELSSYANYATASRELRTELISCKDELHKQSLYITNLQKQVTLRTENEAKLELGYQNLQNEAQEVRAFLQDRVSTASRFYEDSQRDRRQIEEELQRVVMLQKEKAVIEQNEIDIQNRFDHMEKNIARYLRDQGVLRQGQTVESWTKSLPSRTPPATEAYTGPVAVNQRPSHSDTSRLQNGTISEVGPAALRVVATLAGASETSTQVPPGPKPPPRIASRSRSARQNQSADTDQDIDMTETKTSKRARTTTYKGTQESVKRRRLNGKQPQADNMTTVRKSRPHTTKDDEARRRREGAPHKGALKNLDGKTSTVQPAFASPYMRSPATNSSLLNKTSTQKSKNGIQGPSSDMRQMSSYNRTIQGSHHSEQHQLQAARQAPSPSSPLIMTAKHRKGMKRDMSGMGGDMQSGPPAKTPRVSLQLQGGPRRQSSRAEIPDSQQSQRY